MSPLSFCDLLKRTLIGYLLIIVGCFIRKVSVFRIIDRHRLCLIFTVDVESDISCVAHVDDDPDMNENATQAGFFNASQAVMSKMLIVIMSLGRQYFSDGEFTPQQRDG